jgi:chemotaxis signal transduction protein
VSGPHETGETTRSFRFIPAKIGPVWLMLEAQEVQEITGAKGWVPIPHSSPLVPGVLAWRGRAVAVLDLAVLVLLEERLEIGQQRPRTLIVESGDCLLAMPVDLVREVQEVDGTRVREPHVTRVDHSSFEVDIFETYAPLVDLRSLVLSVLAAGPAGT